MKKNKDKILGVILMILFSLGMLTPTTIQAANVTKGTTIAQFKVVKKNNASWYWDQIKFPWIYVDGSSGYCLDPETSIITGSYTATKEFGSYSQSKQNDLFLYAYYGYQYPGHKSTNYYLATQSLIWDVVGWKTTWKTANGKTIINVSKEINEITRLASLHNTKPNFHESEIKMRVGESIELTDKNGVFCEYDLTMVPKQLSAQQVDNTLLLTLNEAFDGLLTVGGKRKSGVEGGSPIVYTKAKSQKLMIVKNSSPIDFNFTVSLDTSSLRLRKVDNWGHNVGDVVFKIGSKEDLSDGIEYTTDVSGNISLALEAGTYYYQEISAPGQYRIDSSIRSLEVKAGEDNTIEVENQVKPVTVKIIKRDSENEEIMLAQAKFALYNVDDRHNEVYITSATTDEKGEAFFPDLNYYSTYEAREIELPPGYDYLDISGCGWIFRPADFPYQETFELRAENRRRRMVIQVVKSDQKEEDQLLNGAIFTVSDTLSGESLGTFVTGGLYIKSESDELYHVFSAENLSKSEFTGEIEPDYSFKTDEDGEIIEFIEEGVYFLVSDVEKKYDFTEDNKRSISYDFITSNRRQTIEVLTGTIIVPELIYGHSYNVCEIKAPLGYTLEQNNCKIVVPEAEYGINTISHHRTNAPVIPPVTGETSRLIVVVMIMSFFGSGFLLDNYYKKKKAKI